MMMLSLQAALAADDRTQYKGIFSTAAVASTAYSGVPRKKNRGQPLNFPDKIYTSYLQTAPNVPIWSVDSEENNF